MPLFLHGGVLCPLDLMWAFYGLMASIPFLRHWISKYRKPRA